MAVLHVETLVCVSTQPTCITTFALLPVCACRELTRWGSAGFATVSLTRAVFHGCLQGLEARQAYSLASALLLFTNGLPLALVCLWHAVEQLGVQLSELAQEALGLMGPTCTAIAQALSVIGEQLDSCSGSEGSAGGERPAASGGSQPLTVARLLRTTAARPALIIAALRRVTSLLTLCAPSCSGNQRGTEGALGSRCGGWRSRLLSAAGANWACGVRWVGQERSCRHDLSHLLVPQQ